MRSETMVAVLRHLNLKTCGGNYRHIKNMIDYHGIDISHFKGRGWSSGIKRAPKYSKDEFIKKFLIDGTVAKAHSIKTRLIRFGLKSGRCEYCGIEEWNGEMAPIELHHKNKNNLDNRLENLAILCPNCHAVAHRKKKKTRVRRKASRSPKIDWPSKSSLEIMVWDKPIRDVARELGVSDVAVHKRCKELGIKKPPRGWWLRKK